jgi:hypothetical protein
LIAVLFGAGYLGHRAKRLGPVDGDVISDGRPFDSHGRYGQAPSLIRLPDEHLVGYEHVGEKHLVELEAPTGLFDGRDLDTG